MPFPSPPWRLTAQMWVSLFAVRSGDEAHPPGLYGAALVDYVEPGVLTYHELLVARLVRDGRTPQVRITDIWVDSATSRDGGRSLWAIPKELADLPVRHGSYGPAVRTSFSGVAEGQHLASAAFTAVPSAARVRAPFAVTLSQEPLDGTGGGAGGPVLTPFGGSTRSLPCRGRWRFDEGGPLAFLSGRRPLLSLHLRDTSLRFG